ncbi:hypothetical protein G6F57_011467 [Rhizopus arrhizus]|uniref:Uncharacterized protein n=1 Tax=Rhizopus oryzae TaxID=64495 RepID=A0A9P6X052_RHIOR|nr:hypothetical protein G6F23_008073 [Rhizopus arrhizus]KAG1253139.1 hypothetical protein G6F68_011471 [Rhizopus microsporus]KAG1412346.1 hypothetical protein G6F58_008059 [Rhizopus delemar]KAG0759678.1 hypothetical protein G6F24_008896 [Rhizopus arrhizus]KAG0791045.1 hypothetical protein G6F21_005371 [Rhizopus arrhizus]
MNPGSAEAYGISKIHGSTIKMSRRLVALHIQKTGAHEEVQLDKHAFKEICSLESSVMNTRRRVQTTS